MSDTAAFAPEWNHPAEAEAFWFRDILHNPAPITPLNATLFQPSFEVGASAAISKLSMPITGLNVGVHHGYVFLGPTPFMGTPEEMEARMAEMQRLTVELGSTILEDWRNIFEPQVLEMANRHLAFDADAASTRQLAQQVAQLHDDMVKAWDIHMRVNIPAMGAVFGFEEFLAAVLGEEAVGQSRLLLQGFDNKSIETGRAIWALSRWARSVAGLKDALMEARVRDGDVELSHAAAAEFASQWHDFLETYGWRSDIFMEFGHPSWREDPSSALLQLKRYLEMDDSADPFLAHSRQAAERERLVAEFAAKVPEPAKPQFFAMLAMAQQYVPIAEDHNFTIDQKFTMVGRQTVLNLGGRLAAEGVLNDAEDVFYLVFDEIKALAAGVAPGDLRARVEERRARRIAQGAMTPPPAIGTPPPADAPVDPLVTKFFGFGVMQGGNPKVVNGYPCSAGVITGTARVILTLDDADRLQPGDILVCPMTMPAWTPLFGVAGAVVSDSGGPLSHCAIVAREYEIPCVAGTLIGTSVIADGATVRVDGGTGAVHIL